MKKFTFFVFIYLFLFISSYSQIVLSIDTTTHHLGDNEGSEGLSYNVTFQFPYTSIESYLRFNFILPFGPNYENPPILKINGSNIGSIQPFFPMEGFPLSEAWVTNGDGSHDCNASFTVVLPITSFLINGQNQFRIENGRPDDDYYFNNIEVFDFYINPLNISEFDKNGIIVFPNPTSEIIQFKSKYHIQNCFPMKIFDLNGKIIFQSNAEFDNPILISQLNSGFYIIEIELKDNKMKFKLIIQK